MSEPRGTDYRDAVLCLGSNLGDRMGELDRAVRTLGPLVRAVSPVFRTPPWGPVPQDDYYNLVLLARDEGTGAEGPPASPMRWLERCRELERQANRVRGVRFGPRTLDADVITVGATVSDDPELTLPHPRAHERAFVLVPWHSVDPDAELRGHGPVGLLIGALPADEVAGIVEIGRIGS